MVFLASFPGLPTIQFLITYSMQKLDGGKAWKRGYGIPACTDLMWPDPTQFAPVQVASHLV